MQGNQKIIGWKSALYPSDNYQWFMEENRKRKAGLMNVIDIADIKAANLGVKNKWHEIVIKHHDEFKKMIETEKFEWEKIMEFKRNNLVK